MPPCKYVAGTRLILRKDKSVLHGVSMRDHYANTSTICITIDGCKNENIFDTEDWDIEVVEMPLPERLGAVVRSRTYGSEYVRVNHNTWVRLGSDGVCISEYTLRQTGWDLVSEGPCN